VSDHCIPSDHRIPPDAPTVFDVGSLISAAVADCGVPGAVAMAGSGPDVLGEWVAGLACVSPRASMTADTVFDLASLTKVVATTTLTLSLLGGELGSPAARYLPSVVAPVTLRQLITHTSGLPASVTFYEWCRDREQLLAELYATPLERPPGKSVVYSDLGFMLLGEIVAVVAGEPLDRVFADLVAGPLGMHDAGYNPRGGTPPAGPPAPAAGLADLARFAATEVYDGVPWIGFVHDENARVLGGVAGHAGLFATVADLARFAQWWVSESDYGPVPAALRTTATTCQTGFLDGRRGFGWTCPGDRYDILAGHWPRTSVSHTGFTGTSLALDPVSGRWVVLLTNGVHSGRDATAVKALRRSVHAALAPEHG
jgi:CubicO group peptidase (beta-lactamase class C family)